MDRIQLFERVIEDINKTGKYTSDELAAVVATLYYCFDTNNVKSLEILIGNRAFKAIK